MSYLRYLCLFVYCVLFLFCLSSSCVPYIVGFSGLSILIVPSVFSKVCLLTNLCRFFSYMWISKNFWNAFMYWQITTYVSTVCRSEQGCKLEEKCNQTLVPDMAITKTRTSSQQPRRTTGRRQKKVLAIWALAQICS